MNYQPEQIFNKISKDYLAVREVLYDNSDQLDTLTKKLAPLPGKRVLELGCGGGNPVLKHFYDRKAEIWGIDISAEMLKVAKNNLPNGHFMHKDMTEIELPKNYFDAILSFYSVFLLDINNQFLLFKKIFESLRLGGLSYFTLLSEAATKHKEFSGMLEYSNNFFYYAHTTPEKYQVQLQKVGFSNIKMEEKCIGNETCLWVICEKEESDG